MINSIHIENFRGFESLDVGGFSKFNLIVGTNGVGKTSFLEAVLVGRSTDLRYLAVLDGMRGWQRQRAGLDSRSVWRYLFLHSDLPFVIDTISKVNSVRVSGQFEPAETHLGADPFRRRPPGRTTQVSAQLSLRGGPFRLLYGLLTLIPEQKRPPCSILAVRRPKSKPLSLLPQGDR